MNTITGCVPYPARYPCKMFLSTWKGQLKHFIVWNQQGATLPELSLKFLKTFVEMYVTCINTMVSVEIGYSAIRPDNSKEMYQLADMHNISNCISKYIKLWVFWKRGQCLSCCGLFVCCFIWVKLMLKLLNFLFTWGYSLHGKTHTISSNMAVALTKVRWA